MAAKIAGALELKAADQLADIGCGTGIYAKSLERLIGFHHPIQCVDPSGPMLKHMNGASKFIPIEKDAISFLESPHTAKKYLIKEAVHHIDDKESLFEAISLCLEHGGILLILH